jgi:glycosyltransferase involved in cell wall biosynthesis
VIGKLLEAFDVGRALRRSGSRVVVARVAGAEIGLIALLARSTGRRFIYSAASDLDFDLGRDRFNRRDRLVYRIGLRLADEIVVQTNRQAELCVETIGRSASVIPSIVAPAERATAPGRYFLWLGRIMPNKRPMEFVELARAMPDAVFTMVAIAVDGYEALLSEVRSTAAEISNLTLSDPVERSHALGVIEGSVAVVSTSVQEGMPNVFLEAWARGVPALALSHDPDGVISRHRLGFCASGSKVRLVGAANDLWAARDESTPVADRCLRYVSEHHSPQVVVARWLDVLRDARATQVAPVLVGDAR